MAQHRLLINPGGAGQGPPPLLWRGLCRSPCTGKATSRRPGCFATAGFRPREVWPDPPSTPTPRAPLPAQITGCWRGGDEGPGGSGAAGTAAPARPSPRLKAGGRFLPPGAPPGHGPWPRGPLGVPGLVPPPRWGDPGGTGETNPTPQITGLWRLRERGGPGVSAANGAPPGRAVPREAGGLRRVINSPLSRGMAAPGPRRDPPAPVQTGIPGAGTVGGSRPRPRGTRRSVPGPVPGSPPPPAGTGPTSGGDTATAG